MATTGTKFSTILSAMKQKIIDDDILPDGDCYIAVRMNPPAQNQRKALVIVPLYQTADPKANLGHGRCARFKSARINIYYRHEDATDQEYQDDNWTVANNAYYDIIDKLEDAFDLWMPQDADNQFLLIEPAQLVMNNEPRKKYQDHPQGEGMIELEVQFKAWRTT